MKEILRTALVCAAFATAARAQTVPAAVEQVADEIAAEFARHCPLAKANDSAAYDGCRRGLFASPVLRPRLPAIVLWGRESKSPGATLRQTNLTQFAPDVWTNMYVPLFMFN